MNEQLSKEIEAKSKAHITNLTCYKIASVIENFAIRSFSLFVKIFEDMSLVNIVINLIKLIIRMPLVIVIYCAVATLLGTNLNLIAILITYIAFYLVIFGVMLAIDHNPFWLPSMPVKTCSLLTFLLT